MLNPWWMVVMCLLNNDSTGFHISGVCSDVCSFNRIMRWIWMLLTRFDRDVIDSAVNSTAFFTVSPSAVYNGVAWSRAAEQITVFFRADNGVERIRFTFGSFVQCSSCKSGMKRTQSRSFHFSNWETTFLWLKARCDDVTGQFRKFASSCENCGVCLLLR